jgi:hypothetical protein
MVPELEPVSRELFDDLKKQLQDARQENEEMMSENYWMDRYKIASKELAAVQAEADDFAEALENSFDGELCHKHPETGVCENGSWCRYCESRAALWKHRGDDGK